MYIGKHSAGVYVDHRQCPGHPDVKSWLSKHCSYLLFGQRKYVKSQSVKRSQSADNFRQRF